MAAVRTRSTYQLHVELGGLTLMELVDEVAEQALLALPESERRRYLPEVRARVEQVLRRHIVAYDTCGLGSLCQDGEPFDPWPAGEHQG
ncbi:MAG: hypothetical protein IMX02_00775 [Limnochordaceae bacterium]|uniref:Uncharacterized protein n=1 Tax=Carboxydichorda subterranea TaxID=3109565 RepID=A0ABZ1BWF3_9FIRM|nr:hypothetical protein [Limnochorda sp. L945t]MBE3597389.1 hypothetical protein [Limnochordaceae bacterium]WRP16438.1 hypothetical protein U7230_10050 [Limnochorda sp. L945t]